VSEGDNHNLPRREFLSRAGKAGISIAAAGLASYALYDVRGPTGAAAGELVELADFSVPPKAGQTISVVHGRQRRQTLEKALDLLGGIERFVRRGETVVIKPNAAFASPAGLGATAHPELVEQIVRLCYDRGGARRVYVTDNPINDPVSCFKISGIGAAAEKAGAEVLLPRAGFFAPTTVAGARLIRNWPILFRPLEKADRVIGISPVKDHHRSGASMSMKNWYGLLGGRRNIFHQDIHTIIAELAMMVRPTLVILDGTQVMMTNGPTGGSLSDLRRADTLIASCDMVAADARACELLGLKVADLPYLSKAEEAGMGRTNYGSLKPRIATTR